MSTELQRGGRGGGERVIFLSAHRCPEVDILPHDDSVRHSPLPCSLVPAEESSAFTCAGQSETNYLDVSPTCRSDKEEEEEEERSVSDWSEEDLSLHFSPSVILPSDDEESDPESGFECIDITVDQGREGEGLKMVPKRQIQLKKKKDIKDSEKLQVKLKDGPAEGGGANSGVLCPTVRHGPDLLLRQNSMPASLHSHLLTGSDDDSYRVCRGLDAEANQGFDVGRSSRQRLQKSFSLDETKTKMASCIIKSILSKKMQVEQITSKTSSLHKKPPTLPSLPQSAEQQRVREGGGGDTSFPGGKTGGGVFKAPVHVVRDMRSLIKNTYSLSFCTTALETNNKPSSFKVIGQEESPPPTYQQAVGVKSHNETKRSSQVSGYSSYCRERIAKVDACLNQSQDRNQSERFSHPITKQRQGSEPIICRGKVDDVTWPVVLLDPPTNPPVSSDLSEISKSEKAGGMSHQDGASLPASVIIPPCPPSIRLHPQGTQPLLSAKDQSSILGMSSQFAPSSYQQILQPCFHPAPVLPVYPPTLHPHIGRVGYVNGPLHYIQTQLLPHPPAPTHHLMRRSEDTRSPENPLDHPDHFFKTYPPQQNSTSEDQGSEGSQGQHEQQQPKQQCQQQQFLCSLQGFLPAQAGSDFIVGMTGSAVAPGALLSGPTTCSVMFDPRSGRCFYMNMPSTPQRKMLLDPETGQYVQVLLPEVSSTPNSSLFQVHSLNPTPIMLDPTHSFRNSAPTVKSVVQFQPNVAVSSHCTATRLPFPHHMPSVNSTHTAP